MGIDVTPTFAIDAGVFRTSTNIEKSRRFGLVLSPSLTTADYGRRVFRRAV